MVWIFLGYLVLTLVLGLWQATRTKSQADFVLGGSKLPGWMLALSERATGESAWLLLGFTGLVFAKGLSAIWVGVGCLTGISTAWLVLAAKFRSESERYKAMTMPEYFSAKFPDKANTIRLVSTLIIVFFFVFYVGAQFAGAGKTIQTTFGLEPIYGQIICAVVILLYATIGGFISVVAVDVFQSVLMIITLIVTPLVLLVKVAEGGLSIPAALATGGTGLDSWTGGLAGFAGGLIIFNHFAWFFGYLGGQPQLNARFMGMRDDRQVRIGRNIAITWTVLAYAGAVGIGLGALTLFGRQAVPDAEMVLPYVLTTMFPWWLAGVLLAGAVAAMVSTAESMLIVAGTSISQDVYQGIVRKGRAPDRTVLMVSRAATLAVGVLGLVMALTTEKLIYTIVSYAWAGIGCSFAPAVLLSFYWDRFRGAGVVTALVAGLVTTVVWIATGLDTTVTAMGVTFAVAMGSAVLVTLARPAKSVIN
ncbi:MAG TPA: sodium/proline symporter [Acidobacteriota bacterium]|jgi:sodium/proline symporter|nr:sodium/proline symporter [Acidobacteriota bacterium]HNR37991.1 sodium/proline symporter [Acidobacteriota bacterium]HNU00433.1 sodium/proline symporter [Acidobacteriota bacterium]HPB28361.1 sodium/proline symporter [Acidobacteriota bacterium]HQO25839.1 sodium/proline symporter [Acidobacteriota bacterium]